MATMEIELTRLFVKVVQHGSYTKAAEFLRMPKSTISKAITKLEADTGTKLLLRTTRSQTLTAAGRAFYATCLGPIQVLEDAQKSLYGQDNRVAGKIKLSAPEDLGNRIITPALSRLCRKYPQLEFETHFTNEIVDLVKDGYDLGIRIGELSESGLKQKKLGHMEMITVASAGFLERTGAIIEPKDLEEVDGIVLTNTGLGSRWVLKNEKKTSTVTLRPRILCNQMSSIITAAIHGAGVALVPSYLVVDRIADGVLIRVLPDWCGPRFPVSVVSPVSMSSSSRLQLLTTEIVNVCHGVFESKTELAKKPRNAGASSKG